MEQDALEQEAKIQVDNEHSEEKALKVIEPETESPPHPLIKLRKTSVESKGTKVQKIQKIDVSEHQPIFSKIQLKKSETVKRVWDKPKPEIVQLKHHEFEVAPQRELEELDTKVHMTQEIVEIKESQTKTRKVKKIKAKKFSEEVPKKEEKEEKAVEKSINQQPESPKQEPPAEAVRQEDEAPTSSENQQKIAIKKKKKKLQKVEEITTEEPALGQETDVSEQQPKFSEVQLKKAETVKRVWDEPKPEVVELKHHEFEVAPQREVEELDTKVLMTKEIEEIKDSQTKTRRVKKVKAKKFSEEVPKKEQQEENTEEKSINQQPESPKQEPAAEPVRQEDEAQTSSENHQKIAIKKKKPLKVVELIAKEPTLGQEMDVSEHQPAFSRIQLKKASTVKRVWDEPKPEVVQLKHHELEVPPQGEVEELATKVHMTKAIEETKASHTKTKRVKKTKIKKLSEDESNMGKPEDEAEEKSIDQPESPKEEPEEPARQEDDAKPQPSTFSQQKIAIKKKKPLKVVERTIEEPALGQVKLRKSSVVKREWDNPELQQVSLKTHILEPKPLDESVRFHFSPIIPMKNLITDISGREKN